MALGFEEGLVVGPGDRVKDEVPPVMLAAEGGPGLRAYCAAVLEGAVQIVGEPLVELPDGRVQGGWSAALGLAAKLCHRRGREDPAATPGSRIRGDSGGSRTWRHERHEAGDTGSG